MAVTLVNNTHIPMSLFGIMRTMKKMLRKPKTRTETLFSNEYVPFENQRAYAIEANVVMYFSNDFQALPGLVTLRRSSSNNYTSFIIGYYNFFNVGKPIACCGSNFNRGII